MKKNIFLILIVFFAAFSSCGTEELAPEKKTEAIEFSQIAVEVQPDEIIEVSILKGVAPFSIVEIDRSIARVNLKKNILRIRGMKEDKVTELKIKGIDGSEATLTIKVNPLPIKFSTETVEIERRGSAIVFITQGGTPDSILAEDESIAKVTLIENKIIIEGLKEGETVLTVKNKLGAETLLPIKVVAPFADFKEDATPRLEYGEHLVDPEKNIIFTAVYAAGPADFGHTFDANLYKAGLTYIDEGDPASIYIAWSGDISVGEKADARLHFGSDSDPSDRLRWLEVVQVKDGKIWVIAEAMDVERTIVKVVVPM